MSDAELRDRIDALVEELIGMGTLESAAVASILLATRAALRDGCVVEAAQALWAFVDSQESQADGFVP
jgi:hypothetical protein